MATNLRIVSNASLSASVATLTLNSSSSINVGDFIRVSGISSSVYNGIFTVSASPSATQISYTLNSASIASASVSGSVEYISYDSKGRPAYMYDVENNKWVEIAGRIDTGKNYTFNGYNTFNSTTRFNGPIKSNSASGAVSFQIIGAHGQSSNIFEAKNSASSTLFYLDKNITLNANSASVGNLYSASSSFLNVSSNNTNFTNSYSNSASVNNMVILNTGNGLEIIKSSNQAISPLKIKNNSGSNIFSIDGEGFISLGASVVSVGGTSLTGFLRLKINETVYRIPLYS